MISSWSSLPSSTIASSSAKSNSDNKNSTRISDLLTSSVPRLLSSIVTSNAFSEENLNTAESPSPIAYSTTSTTTNGADESNEALESNQNGDDSSNGGTVNRRKTQRHCRSVNTKTPNAEGNKSQPPSESPKFTAADNTEFMADENSKLKAETIIDDGEANENKNPAGEVPEHPQQQASAMAMVDIVEAQKAFQKFFSCGLGFGSGAIPWHCSTSADGTHQSVGGMGSQSQPMVHFPSSLPLLAEIQRQFATNNNFLTGGGIGGSSWIDSGTNNASNGGLSEVSPDEYDDEEENGAEDDVDECLLGPLLAKGTEQPQDLSLRNPNCMAGESIGLLAQGGSSQNIQLRQQQQQNYVEQFKQVGYQLYELSPDPKRKEWLDDWLAYMNRIGKTVTRAPIMAKQVLDLYELYHLVVSRGGILEVINKKLWGEITSGLNLPKTITSAAFTLRTQYVRYLYEYEQHHHRFSTCEELNAAIASNKREGRKTSSNPSQHQQIGGIQSSTSARSAVAGGWQTSPQNMMAMPVGQGETCSTSLNLQTHQQQAAMAMVAATFYPQFAGMNAAALFSGKHLNDLHQQQTTGTTNGAPNGAGLVAFNQFGDTSGSGNLGLQLNGFPTHLNSLQQVAALQQIFGNGIKEEQNHPFASSVNQHQSGTGASSTFSFAKLFNKKNQIGSSSEGSSQLSAQSLGKTNNLATHQSPRNLSVNKGMDNANNNASEHNARCSTASKTQSSSPLFPITKRARIDESGTAFSWSDTVSGTTSNNDTENRLRKTPRSSRSSSVLSPPDSQGGRRELDSSLRINPQLGVDEETISRSDGEAMKLKVPGCSSKHSLRGHIAKFKLMGNNENDSLRLSPSSMSISLELDGVLFEGVLFATADNEQTVATKSARES